MPTKIVIIGAGFAGVWAALAAQRLINIKNKKDDVKVTVIAPQPTLTLRPRLYEADPASMSFPLGDLFRSAGINFVQGTVETIETGKQSIFVATSSGEKKVHQYDRLVLAAGSAVSRPPSVDGLQEHSFDVDTIFSAARLEAHLKNLAVSSIAASPAEKTIVVCGGGPTGIELSSELPERLAKLGLEDARVILVEGSDKIGAGLGSAAQLVISDALLKLGVETKTASRVSAVNADGVVLASGEHIPSKTVVWTAGMKATPLTQQIPGLKDPLGRLNVDQTLRVPEAKHVFATGDTAYVVTDPDSTGTQHYAVMSCQHALVLGRVAGHNAAADLFGEDAVPYSQTAYNCCLDLGTQGALVTAGWEFSVRFTGEQANLGKRFINGNLIYPPATAEEALFAANPIVPDGGDAFAVCLA